LTKSEKSPNAMSRRRRAAIAAVCVVSVAVLVWLDYNRPGRTRPTTNESKEQATADDFERYHGKIFKVANVVDGDTIDIDVPDAESDHTRIRLLGIDTPESKSPKVGVMYFGPEAAEFARKLLLGKDVRIYLDEGTRTRGYYGRVLAYVQLPDKTFFNEMLIQEGYAYADLRFRHSHYNRYKQLDSAARGQKKGLWAEVTREQLPQWLQKKKPKLLQAK